MPTAPQYPAVKMNWMDAYGVDYMRKALGEDGVSLVDNPSFVGDWTMYTISLYWSCMTLSTIGYGDITATNPTECVVASCLMPRAVRCYPSCCASCCVLCV